MKLTHISPSSLDLYSKCPYCFYLKTLKVEQPHIEAFSFGRALHDAIECYHKGKDSDCGDEIVLSMLEEYMEIYDEDYEVCEELLEVPLFDLDIPLRFRMDLIKDGWIMEHKTSSARYSQDEVDYHKQATAYSYAYRILYGKEEEGIRFNIFNKKVQKARLQMLDTYRTTDDFSHWEGWVRDILTKIEEDQFEPKPSRFHIYTLCPMNSR